MAKSKHEDIGKMSDDDLMKEWTALGKEVQAGKERLAAFSQEHQRREREAQLRNAVGDLSPEDLALLQSMEPVGVESEESHNG
jgi:hypothetical protein